MSFLTDLGAALAAGATDRAAGRTQLTALWDGLAHDDDAGRCILAHYLADAADDLAQEVRWDEIALASSEGLTDADLQTHHPTLTVLGFLPSLRLNLADGYRRQGRFEEASRELEASIAGNDALPTTLPEQVGYREMILAAQARAAEQIAVRDGGTVGS